MKGNHTTINQALAPDWHKQLQSWGMALGFSQIGVTGVDLTSAEPGLLAWLAQGFHGDMHYMQAHGLRRARPAELIPGTLSVITARMNYLPDSSGVQWRNAEFERLSRPGEAVVSVYARGRDYHKVLRGRLQQLAQKVQASLGPLGHRVFVDSAPVLEVELAHRSAIGWRGKHTLLLHRQAGSMFFLGEIYVDAALPATGGDAQESTPEQGNCGSCSACLDMCPTKAIVAPYRVDARRCISYLTIEHQGSIAPELRPLMGNHIYGCDDCQLVCPWNKFAQPSSVPDFAPRAGLYGQDLVDVFTWSEEDFLRRTEGTPIRRIGHVRWLRNCAVALGNAIAATQDKDQRHVYRLALHNRSEHPSALVREHVQWALAQ